MQQQPWILPKKPIFTILVYYVNYIFSSEHPT